MSPSPEHTLEQGGGAMSHGPGKHKKHPGSCYNVWIGISVFLGIVFLVVGLPIAVVARNQNQFQGYPTLYTESTWVDMGGRLLGVQEDEEFGESVHLNSNGDVVAIGANLHNQGRGVARAFRYDGTTWKRIGGILKGSANGENFGFSVQLDQTGHIMAIGGYGNNNNPGVVRVYRYRADSSSTTKWHKIGHDVKGDQKGERFGVTLSMALDGKSFLVGADNYRPTSGTRDGYVQCYQFDGTTDGWIEKGSRISGSDGSYTGHGASMSGSGHVICVGDREYVIPDLGKRGRVRCYTWSGGDWQRRGIDILGEVDGEQMGYSVALSDDGNTVVTGSRGGGSDKEGSVKVFRFNGGGWTQIGQTLVGNHRLAQAGFKVSISADAQVIAYTARGDNTNGEKAGMVKAFRRGEGGEWEQLGADIHGEADDNFGESVSLSNDGTILAASSNWNTDEYVTVMGLVGN